MSLRTDLSERSAGWDVLGFPNPVNEKAARVVAGGVLTLAVVTLVGSLVAGDSWLWLSVVLALGFLARVLTGPTLSPLGQLATRVIAPRLGPPKLVAGPPKRFAQAIGLTVTGAAAVATAFGGYGVTQVLLGLIIVAATLESVFALCLGCTIFGVLMRVGLVPEETCEACANLALPHA
jgi:uncharacterized protein DUF4395